MGLLIRLRLRLLLRRTLTGYTREARNRRTASTAIGDLSGHDFPRRAGGRTECSSVIRGTWTARTQLVWIFRMTSRVLRALLVRDAKPQ